MIVQSRGTAVPLRWQAAPRQPAWHPSLTRGARLVLACPHVLSMFGNWQRVQELLLVSVMPRFGGPWRGLTWRAPWPFPEARAAGRAWGLCPEPDV